MYGLAVDDGNEIFKVKPEEWGIPLSKLLRVVTGIDAVPDGRAATDAEARARLNEAHTRIHTRPSSTRREQTNRISQSQRINTTWKQNHRAMPIFNFFSFPARTIPRSTSFFPSHIPTPVYEPWEAIHAVMCILIAHTFVGPWIVQSNAKRTARTWHVRSHEKRSMTPTSATPRRQFADFNSRHEDGPDTAATIESLGD